MTTTRMIVSGAAVLLTLMLIGEALVAAIVIGLAALSLFLLTMSSGSQWRAGDIDGTATAPPTPGRRGPKRIPKRILVFHQF